MTMYGLCFLLSLRTASVLLLPTTACHQVSMADVEASCDAEALGRVPDKQAGSAVEVVCDVCAASQSHEGENPLRLHLTRSCSGRTPHEQNPLRISQMAAAFVRLRLKVRA